MRRPTFHGVPAGSGAGRGSVRGSSSGRARLMKGIHFRAAMALLIAWLALGCQPTRSEPESEQPPAGEALEREHFTVAPDQVTWLTPPPQAAFLPKGVKIALIEGGSPLDKGPFTFRLRFPPGSRLMPHTHPTTDKITVISGTLHQGIGRVFDQTGTEAVAAGGFVYHAGGTPHFVWFDEETVLQFHGMGPFGLTYLDPADDPRNQK